MVRSYGYSYDNLNRLINAQYIRPTLSGNANVEHSFDETLTYDKNGNIQSLVRNGGMEIQSGFNIIDDLAYTYNPTSPNQLIKVDDATNDTDGFKDEANTTAEYGYDLNGNMTRDDNKQITEILYNHLNLPTQITFVGTNRKINYLYTATGQKVQKIVNDNLVLSVTDYMGGYQYNNDLLQFFPHAEGYVKNTLVGRVNSFDYVFSYLDHLGNVRLNYGLVNGVLTKFEENNYYPFGLKHKNYNYNLKEIQEKKETKIIQEFVPATAEFAEIPEIKEEIFDKKAIQKEEEYFEKMAAIKNQEPISLINLVPNSGYQKRFQSKNWEDELDLNVFDFGARQFDPAIVRTPTLDPMAEKFYSLSPQSFLNNNPLSFIDPTGMEAIPPIGYDQIDGKIHTDKDGSWVYNQNSNSWVGQNGANDIDNAKYLNDVVIESIDPNEGTYFDRDTTPSGEYAPYIPDAIAITTTANISAGGFGSFGASLSGAVDVHNNAEGYVGVQSQAGFDGNFSIPKISLGISIDFIDSYSGYNSSIPANSIPDGVLGNIRGNSQTYSAGYGLIAGYSYSLDPTTLSKAEYGVETKSIGFGAGFNANAGITKTWTFSEILNNIKN